MSLALWFSTLSLPADTAGAVVSGPLNSWDRLPFLTDVRYGVPSFEPLPNEISRNFISADYGGSQSFDNDDVRMAHPSRRARCWLMRPCRRAGELLLPHLRELLV